MVCQAQPGEMHCPHGSFLYIMGAVYGHSQNETQQNTTDVCSLRFARDTCYEETLDFLSFTTEESITNIQLPNRNITCTNGSELPINYAHIEHVCVPGMNSQHIFVSIITVRCLNTFVNYGLEVISVCLSVSSFCGLIRRHWTYKLFVRYILSSGYLRLSQFSQSSFAQYMGLSCFSLPVSFVTIENVCNLSYYHLQIRNINH